MLSDQIDRIVSGYLKHSFQEEQEQFQNDTNMFSTAMDARVMAINLLLLLQKQHIFVHNTQKAMIE